MGCSQSEPAKSEEVEFPQGALARAEAAQEEVKPVAAPVAAPKPVKLEAQPAEPEKTASDVPAQEDRLDSVEQFFKELKSMANQDQLTKMGDVVPPNVAVARRPSTVELRPADYVAQHESDFAELLKLDKETKWVFKKKEMDVDVFTCLDEKLGLVSFKGTAEVNVGGQKDGLLRLLSEFFHPELRPQFDDACTKGETLEQYFPYYRVVYFNFKSPLPGVIMDRDICLQTRFKEQDDGTFLVSVASRKHDLKPETPAFTRAEFIRGGYIVRPTGKDGVLQVTYLGCVDMLGWIPTFVKNLVAWKQPLVIGKFKKMYNV